MRKIIKYIISKTVRPFIIKYLSKTRIYKYGDITLEIPTEVFHPGFFFSTKILLRYILQLNLSGKTLLELGAGNGLIAFSAAHTGALVTASDINSIAVDHLKKNEDRNNLSINVVHSDLYDHLPQQIFDIIVVNPPYYKKDPKTEAEHAWYCGINGSYFTRFFASLSNYINERSQTIMILSDDCDLEMIKTIAADTHFSLSLVKRKRILLEQFYIYEIKKINNSVKENEQLAAQAFSNQSSIFDSIYEHNTIVQYKRDRVRSHINLFIQPGSHILELNAGTGDDAIYFADHSHYVHATDISEGMQNELKLKVAAKNLQAYITNELCSFTELHKLKNKGPYDLIFSNFAGLNCTGDLDKLLQEFAPLLNTGGLVSLVILPPFCLWETLLLFKGHFKTAFRRSNSKNGIQAHVEGVHFTCWYYKPSFIINALKNDFELLSVEGLCSIVPPSYIEHFAENHSRAYKTAVALENHLKNKWPWKHIGDYYIITLKKKN